MKFLGVALLSAGVSGAVLKKGTFLEDTKAESRSLSTQSRALDHELQSYADTLEPGATKEFLRTLRLCAPCSKYERFGEPHDGGYVMCSDGLDTGLKGAYSYGINGFDGWGMAVASRYHIPLNEYDCTNLQEPVPCSGCHVNFHGKCILANGDYPKWNYQTMTEMMKENGDEHAADRSLLLKIDVEAAEWTVFAQEPVENMRKYREIVVEYHWLSKSENHDLYLKAVKKIEQAGFSVTHLHGNNYGGGLQHFGEYSIPNVLEVTYIKTPSAGCAANIPYHTPQDMPNNANGAEIGDAVLPKML